MKRILFITAFSPSKRTGGQNFTRLLLADLSRKNEIDLVLFSNSFFEYELPEKNVNIKMIFQVNKWKKLLNALLFFPLFPFFTCRFNLYYLHKINQVLNQKEYDFIYLDYSQVFIYGLFFRRHKKILMSHDIICQRYERLFNVFLTKVLLSFCSASESFLLKNINRKKIFTFSEKDSNILKNKYNIESEPTSFYIDTPINRNIESVFRRIILFGSWRRPENLEGLIWFFDNVYDRIDKNINVFIIGGGLPNEQNKRIETNDNIHYLGFLEDPSQIISESILLIAPIFHGAGVKVKVVEALALGCAVLGTDIAFEGISIEDAEFVLTANSIDEFILKINTYNIDIQSKETFRRNFQKSYLNHAVSKYINSDYSSNG